MRRIVGIVTAVGLGLVGLVAAPPASAAQTWTVYLCTGSGELDPGTGPQTVHASPGDTVVLQNNCFAETMVFGFPSDSTVFAFPPTAGIAPGGSSAAAVVGVGTGVQAAYADGLLDVPLTTVTVISNSVAPPAPIPDWIQAYGRSGPDQDCPAGYNPSWAGGPGAEVVAYTKSWQQWMNLGTGGWVCTRTIPSLG